MRRYVPKASPLRPRTWALAAATLATLVGCKEAEPPPEAPQPVKQSPVSTAQDPSSAVAQAEKVIADLSALRADFEEARHSNEVVGTIAGILMEGLGAEVQTELERAMATGNVEGVVAKLNGGIANIAVQIGDSLEQHVEVPLEQLVQEVAQGQAAEGEGAAADPAAKRQPPDPAEGGEQAAAVPSKGAPRTQAQEQAHAEPPGALGQPDQGTVAAGDRGARTGATDRYQAGDAVEIEWSHKWYPGRILEAGSGRWKIRYDGYSESWDEWVGSQRLRRPSAR